jgi:hypothetical protein
MPLVFELFQKLSTLIKLSQIFAALKSLRQDIPVSSPKKEAVKIDEHQNEYAKMIFLSNFSKILKTQKQTRLAQYS